MVPEGPSQQPLGNNGRVLEGRGLQNEVMLQNSCKTELNEEMSRSYIFTKKAGCQSGEAPKKSRSYIFTKKAADCSAADTNSPPGSLTAHVWDLLASQAKLWPFQGGVLVRKGPEVTDPSLGDLMAILHTFLSTTNQLRMEHAYSEMARIKSEPE